MNKSTILTKKSDVSSGNITDVCLKIHHVPHDKIVIPPLSIARVMYPLGNCDVSLGLHPLMKEQNTLNKTHVNTNPSFIWKEIPRLLKRACSKLTEKRVLKDTKFEDLNELKKSFLEVS